MARKRLAGTKLQSWDQVDEALKGIGTLELELGAIEADLNRGIMNLKEVAQARSEPLVEKKAALELAIKEFAEARREEFKTRRTRRLTFGSVGFRASTKIMIRNVKKCVEAMASLGLKRYLKVKASPDKDAMRDLDDETLRKVGARRKTEDAFGYEVDFEKLKEAA